MVAPPRCRSTVLLHGPLHGGRHGLVGSFRVTSPDPELWMQLNDVIRSCKYNYQVLAGIVDDLRVPREMPSGLQRPGHGNFDFQPIVYRGPYEYGSPESDKDYYPQTQPPPETAPDESGA